jgi:hypothetical protein
LPFSNATFSRGPSNRAKETYEWYRWRLQLFIESIDKKLLANQLKYFHIDEWLLKRADWSPGTKHGMARAVMWALPTAPTAC